MLLPIYQLTGKRILYNSVVNMYAKVISRRKGVAVVVRNVLTTTITIAKGIKFTQMVAANVVPPVEATPNILEKSDEIHGI